MRALGLLLAVAVAVAMPASATHWWQQGPTLPSLTGRVVDNARLLSAKDEASLAKRFAQLERSTGHQFVVVTVPSLQGESIEQFGIRLGRTWGVGRKGVDDGVLLIVAPAERKVRIEVGRGLEKQLSDPVCARIIHDAILPRFRQQLYREGIVAGADAVIARIGK